MRSVSSMRGSSRGVDFVEDEGPPVAHETTRSPGASATVGAAAATSARSTKTITGDPPTSHNIAVVSRLRPPTVGQTQHAAVGRDIDQLQRHAEPMRERRRKPLGISAFVVGFKTGSHGRLDRRPRAARGKRRVSRGGVTQPRQPISAQTRLATKTKPAASQLRRDRDDAFESSSGDATGPSPLTRGGGLELDG